MSLETISKKHFVARSSSVRSGFTLIELLVTVAIIGVLAGLLTTALNQAKGRAHQITCLNNLRQLQTAWILYAEDNEDYLALNLSESSSNENLYGRRNTRHSWVTGNPKEDLATAAPERSIASIQRGTLFPYLKSAGIYRCPAGSGVNGTVQGMRHYSISTYMNGDDMEKDSRIKTSLADVQAQPASEVFVFMEEALQSPWLGSFFVMPGEKVSLSASASSRFVSVPGAWHRDGADVSFADGHVEYWKWSSFSQTRADKASVRNRLESDDVRRLQAAIPGR